MNGISTQIARIVASLGLFLTAYANNVYSDTNDIAGRVLHLSMDELRAGAFVDLVTSNDLGRATNVRILAQGKLNGACEFAGKNSFVSVPNTAALNPKRITFALWFKTGKEIFPARFLLEKGSERGYALSIAGGGKENVRRGRLRAMVNGRDCLSDASVTDDLWHHAAAVFDGHALKLYVDGRLQKQTAVVPGNELASNAYDLTLGLNRSAPSAQARETSFEGALDEVMIFNRALDEAEIKRLCSSVKPKFTKQQVERRVRELKDLLSRGLILQDFYDRKMQECEVVD